MTPLHMAANNGYYDLAEVLLNNQADVDSRTKSLRTPLHLATMRGRIEFVKLLLDKGANVNC